MEWRYNKLYYDGAAVGEVGISVTTWKGTVYARADSATGKHYIVERASNYFNWGSYAKDWVWNVFMDSMRAAYGADWEPAIERSLSQPF